MLTVLLFIVALQYSIPNMLISVLEVIHPDNDSRSGWSYSYYNSVCSLCDIKMEDQVGRMFLTLRLLLLLLILLWPLLEALLLLLFSAKNGFGIRKFQADHQSTTLQLNLLLLRFQKDRWCR